MIIMLYIILQPLTDSLMPEDLEEMFTLERWQMLGKESVFLEISMG